MGSCFFIYKNHNEEEQTNLIYYVLIPYLYKDPETITQVTSLKTQQELVLFK